MTGPLEATPYRDNSSSPPQNEILLGRVASKSDDGLRKGHPITVPREFLKETHMHIRGRTRCGKTSLALLPLVLQLMEEYEADGEVERDPIFIFDNGGDRPMFNAVKNAVDAINLKAGREVRKFRYLSLDPERSFYFDPFQNVPDVEHRAIRLCNLLVEAFHLDHGLVYGGSYFTQKNLDQLLSIADRAVQEKKLGRNSTLKDIVDFIDQNQIKDAEQVRMILTFLSRYRQLGESPDPDFAIDMKRAIRDREVIYFFTPTLGEATTARQIAGLGLYTAINSSIGLGEVDDGTGRATPVPHSHIFVDEFQELAGRSFEALLAQAAKHGMTLYCANQSTEQLRNSELSIADVIRDNTAAKLYFTITGKQDIEDLEIYSKEDRDWIRSERDATGVFLPGGGGGGSGRTERFVTKLRRDKILDVSATKGEYFIVLEDGSGHREPIHARGHHVTSWAEFKDNKWRLVPCVKLPPPAKRDLRPLWQRSHDAEPVGELAELQKKLSQLYRMKEMGMYSSA